MKLKHNKVATLTATLITFGSLAGRANAALVLNPVGLQAVSVSTTSDLGGSNLVNNTINSTAYTTEVTSWADITILAYDGGGSNGHHTSFGASSGSITLDMGGSFVMDRARLDWMNGGSNNNYGDFTILISDDASFGTSNLAFTNTGNPNSDFELIDFTDGFEGQFVRLNWTSIKGNFGGLSEIIIGGEVAAVPEPSSAILLGLGALSIVARRRRN